MNKSMMRMLGEIMDVEDDDKREVLPTLEGQRLLLEDFLNLYTEHSQSLKVGEYVVRNEIGKPRYKFPRDGQLARVVSVFDVPVLAADGRIAHGEIAIVHEKGEVLPHPVDFRYYRLAPREAATDAARNRPFPTNPATYQEPL